MDHWKVVVLFVSILIIELDASCPSTSGTEVYTQVFSLDLTSVTTHSNPDTAEPAETQVCITTSTNTCSYCR